MQSIWSVPREWAGEVVFIVAGGPSVLAQDLSALAGRRVIAINCSFRVVPAADVLFFGDDRFWPEYRGELDAFRQRIVTTASTVRDPRVLRLHRHSPPGLSTRPDMVTWKRTSLHGGINLAVHFGARKIVLLGADGGPLNGRTHHHAPHRWPARPTCWREQGEDLATTVKPLNQMKVEIVNTNPNSAWTFWPFESLERAARPDLAYAC